MQKIPMAVMDTITPGCIVLLNNVRVPADYNRIDDGIKVFFIIDYRQRLLPGTFAIPSAGGR
jgi:hypothetical protein